MRFAGVFACFAVIMSFSREDRRVAFDKQPDAFRAIGDEATAKNETFVGFELDLESHSFRVPRGRLKNPTAHDKLHLDHQSNRSTFCSACAAKNRAVVDDCCRACKASKSAPSSLLSAGVKFSAPVCSAFIIALVKS